MYKVLLKKIEEFFLVDRTFKNIECDYPITCESRENREALTTDEHCLLNTCLAQFCPTLISLIGMIINTSLIKPNDIFLGKISITCKPGIAQLFIPLQGSNSNIFAGDCEMSHFL